MKMLVRYVQSRQDYVDYLQLHLPPYAEFLRDTAGNAMLTFLEAMRVAGNDPCLHMEEDILLTTDFESKVLRVVSEHANEVIQFFSMRKADLEIGSRYENGRTFMMNQCFYLPANYSNLIADYYEGWDRKKEHPTGYDILIADFLKDRKEKYYLSCPSLVQHRECRSIINPKRPSCRQSRSFVDAV